MKQSNLRNLLIALAIGLLSFASISKEANAKPLEFSAAYGSYWSMPLPKIKLVNRSVVLIESESHFKRIFGVSSNLNLNWHENFLILVYSGQRSSAGYGLSVDALDLNTTKVVKSKKAPASSKISVTVTETTPGQFCLTSSVITQAVALVKVKRNKHLMPNRSKRVSAVLEAYNAIPGSACAF